MAGGVLKGFGVAFLILGGVLLLGGVVAAVGGFFVLQQEQEQGALGDGERADNAKLVMTGGGIAGGAGALLLIVGGILAAAGGARARNAFLAALRGGSGAAPASAETAAKRRRAGWIAGIVVLALVVGGIAFAWGGGETTLSPASLLGSEATPASSLVPQTEAFQGHVQGVATPLAGANSQLSDAVHVLTPEFEAGVLAAELNYTAGALSPSSLVVVLEVQDGDAWKEVARGEGGPGTRVETAVLTFAGDARARVFVGGAGAADQDYELVLSVTPASA